MSGGGQSPGKRASEGLAASPAPASRRRPSNGGASHVRPTRAEYRTSPATSRMPSRWATALRWVSTVFSLSLSLSGDLAAGHPLGDEPEDLDLPGL